MWTSGTEDIDPHYTYSELASAVALLVYEMLLILKGDTTDEFEPMLAESWEVSEDQSTYTFKLYPDVMFHDGTPANAQAVKDSYTRWIELEGSPSTSLPDSAIRQTRWKSSTKRRCASTSAARNRFSGGHGVILWPDGHQPNRARRERHGR